MSRASAAKAKAKAKGAAAPLVIPSPDVNASLAVITDHVGRILDYANNTGLNDHVAANVAKLATLRLLAAVFHEAESEYDKVRKELMAIFLAGGGQPLTCPGWQVTFIPRDKAGYEVAARTEHHINVSRMVPAT